MNPYRKYVDMRVRQLTVRCPICKVGKAYNSVFDTGEYTSYTCLNCFAQFTIKRDDYDIPTS